MRTLKQKQYWLRRQSNKRLVESEAIGEQGIQEMIAVYDQALRNTNKEITKIYSTYANKTGLAVDELALILNQSEKTKLLASLRRVMLRLGVKFEDVYKPEYLFRLSRLEAIKEQIYWQIAQISTLEINISAKTYKEIVETSYKNFQKDISTVGVVPSFSTINKEVVNQIIATNWLGSNYSKRIWKNDKYFAGKIRTILGGALASGQSYQKTAMEIRERFGVAKYNAIRLVRTETNYFHNQSAFQAMLDDGIKRYQFDAVMDGRTSQVCEDHNGKIYNLKDKEVGVNYPPLHPNCRSIPQPLFSNETKYIRKRPIVQ